MLQAASYFRILRFLSLYLPSNFYKTAASHFHSRGFWWFYVSQPAPQHVSPFGPVFFFPLTRFELALFQASFCSLLASLLLIHPTIIEHQANDTGVVFFADMSVFASSDPGIRSVHSFPVPSLYPESALLRPVIWSFGLAEKLAVPQAKLYTKTDVLVSHKSVVGDMKNHHHALLSFSGLHNVA